MGQKRLQQNLKCDCYVAVTSVEKSANAAQTTDSLMYKITNDLVAIPVPNSPAQTVQNLPPDGIQTDFNIHRILYPFSPEILYIEIPSLLAKR